MSTQSSTTPNPASMTLVEAMRGGTAPQVVHPAPQPKIVIPMKVALFGEQGTGKTTTAALLAAALSKELHGGAPVWVTDPELGWQFAKFRIFRIEGIDLVQRTVPTFKAMLQDLRDAERAGACVWAVELQKIWLELLKTVKKECGQNWGSQLSAMWTDYVNAFLNSKMHCMGLGRVGDVTEEVLDEHDDIRRIKTGEKMKVGGSNSFGYEPHLVVRMSLEQKPKKKNGQVFEGEGRMVHCGYVLKDRLWTLNGQMLRWSDKAGYKPGGYRQVWDSFRAHFADLQASGGIVTLDTAATSSDMINDTGDSEWYARQRRLEVLRGELRATMELLFGGQTKEAKAIRIRIYQAVFGFKSNEAADAASLSTIERGVRILQKFENMCQENCLILSMKEEGILAELDKAIAAYDQGLAEEAELPF